MNVETGFSQAEIKFLREAKLLKGLPDSFFEKFIESSTHVVFEHHSPVYIGKNDVELSFTIILDGCIAVWDDSFGRDTIDALLTKGQLFGEFDFLGYPTRNIELVSLTETSIAKINVPRLRELLNNAEEDQKEIRHIFFNNLANTLVEKLMAQNTFLKFRTGDYSQRIAKLFDNFMKPEWQYLTNQALDHVKRSYEVNIFFNREDLRGIIEGEWRSIGPALSKLIKTNILTVRRFDQNQNDLGNATYDEFGTTIFPDCRYFLIGVCDRDLLSEHSIGLDTTRKRPINK